MAIYNGNKLAKKLYVGTKPVRAVYAGSQKVWPSVVRVARGVNYGAWTYADPVRHRTATPWEQDIYCDDSVGDVRYGATSTQEETATTAVDWDGSTYWNGSCGSNYYYVDYKKVRTRYTYNDVTRYSGYYNGDSRSRRIEGSCGWVRDWRVLSDWANNGYTCNAAGTRGAYDCSSTYCVRYNQQQRTLSYCFPDKSGSTQTKVEYRAGSENSRAQEDGKCGYSATPILELSISVLTAHQAQTPCEECTDVSNMFNIYKDASGNYHIDFDHTTQNCGFDSLIIKLGPVYYVECSNKEIYSEDYIQYQDDITSAYNIHHNRGLFAFGPFRYLIDKEDFRGQSDFCGELDIRTLEEDAQVLVYLSLLGF